MTNTIKLGGILIDGSDQNGKTTFCEKLAELTGLKFIHYVYNGNVDQVEYYTRPIRLQDGPYLIDRNYMSELVYGGVIRGKSLIDESMKNEIESMYKNANYFLVLLDRKDLTIDKLEDRKEEFNKEQIMDVKTAMLEVYPSINLDKMIVDAWDPNAIQTVFDYWKQKNNIS